MTKIINLTPHEINIMGYGKIPASGIVVRCEERTTKIGDINGISIIKKSLGDVVNLPEPENDTIYIVGLPVAQASNRPDVYSIGESVRDEKGNITGCKSLATLKEF